MVNLVGVAGLVATGGGKGEFGYSVESVLDFGLVYFNLSLLFLSFGSLGRVGGRLAFALAKELLDLLTCSITRLGETLIVGCRNLGPVSSLTLRCSLTRRRTVV